MSTIKSSDEHLTINADGSGKEVKIQRDGTEVLATTSSGVDISGSVSDTDGNVRSGRKNLIINGGFDVWQRGTSFSGLSVYSYFADRWQCAISTTCSRSTDTPTDEGFNYSAKLEAGSGGNILRMMLEDSNKLLGSNSFTFSFWIKGSVASTGGMDVGDQQSKSFSITTSWTKITQNFTEISTTAHGGTANDYFDITSSVAGDFYITGVQLELGSVATDFEHRSYGEELALCQRYFQQWADDGTTTLLASGYVVNNAIAQFNFKFNGEMRTAPTMSSSGSTSAFQFGSHGENSYEASIPIFELVTKNRARIRDNTFSSVIAGNGAYLYMHSGNNGKIKADAEL